MTNEKLFEITNKLAEEIKNIKEKMRGRGILAAEAPLIIVRLEEVENTLRQIGSHTWHR